LGNISALDIPAILAPVLESYGELFTLARDLSDRAAATGQIEPADLLVQRRMLETVESQLASMRVLLQMVRGERIE
jgi:hypothetical protein